MTPFFHHDLFYCGVLNNNSSSHVQSLTAYLFDPGLCTMKCLRVSGSEEQTNDRLELVVWARTDLLLYWLVHLFWTGNTLVKELFLQGSSQTQECSNERVKPEQVYIAVWTVEVQRSSNSLEDDSGCLTTSSPISEESVFHTFNSYRALFNN